MTIPTLGRQVILHGLQSNGSVEHPAIITRSWGGQRSTTQGPIAVNLTVFPDAAMPQVHTSVMLFDDEDKARAHCAGRVGAMAAYWPPRTNWPPKPAP